ncbi:MAG: hypothetical protein ABUL44_04250, partial [Flavobacterium sp.]
ADAAQVSSVQAQAGSSVTVSSGCSLELNAVVIIPDPAFKAKLLAADVSNPIASLAANGSAPISYVKIDANNDGEIQILEALRIKYLDVSGIPNLNGGITNMKGIEAFVYLESLNCSYNQVTNVDFEHNTNLYTLHCGNNQLINLDVTYNRKLQTLYCNDNQLTSLDVSHNSELQDLRCEYNQLTSLVIGSIDIQTLYCNNNQLTSLDCSTNRKLKTLYCESNQLTTLIIRTSLNTSDPVYPWLQDLRCGNNQLTSLDITNNRSLGKLDCQNNQLTSLGIMPIYLS